MSQPSGSLSTQCLRCCAGWQDSGQPLATHLYRYRLVPKHAASQLHWAVLQPPAPVCCLVHITLQGIQQAVHCTSAEATHTAACGSLGGGGGAAPVLASNAGGALPA